LDLLTLRAYEESASELAGRYETADMADFHGILIRHLPSACSILEVGCGSGRDAAFLLKHGYEITAMDASHQMLEEAAKRHPELAPRLHVAAVPFDSDCPLLRLKFSAVLVIALVMHLTDDELKETINQFRGILNPGGTVILSASIGREEIANGRDPNGRLYIERPPSDIEKLFLGGGFERIASYQNSDSLDRPVKWFTLVFEQRSDKNR
jgi:SAM-dependent methyltransferase